MPEEVGGVLGVLWDCLSEMKDDLSSSVGFVMELLGMFMELILTEYSPCGRQAIEIRSFHCGFIQIGFRVSYPCCHVLYGNLERSIRISSLVPVLFPFFRHTIANVRLAVVNTLHNFLSVPNLADDWITEPVLRLLFQNLIMEERVDTQTITLKAWRVALLKLRGLQPRLLHVISPLIRDWFALLMTHLGVPIQTGLLYQYIPTGAEEGHNVDKSMIAQDLSLVSTETIIRARVAGS